MKVDVSPIVQLTERCNLTCDYCYLKEKTLEDRRDMNLETAEAIIKSFLSYNDKYGHFTWAGGEPLLLGDDYLLELISLGNKHNVKGLKVSHSLQTNGVKLDSERRKRLIEGGFKVGTSFDGCADLQSALRSGEISDNILQNIISADRGLGIISVLTKKTLGREEEVYNNLKKLTTRARINFYVPSGRGLSKVDDLLPEKEETLNSILKFYELWKNDADSIILNPFNSIVRGFFTGWPKTCEYSAYSCYRLLGSDPVGNIFLCSRSTHLPETKLGNIHENSLEEMIGSDIHNQILDRYFILKEGQCKDCDWFNMCSGGCPIEAISYQGDIMNKTYYCEVKKGLFNKIDEDLKNENIGRRIAGKIGFKI